MTRPHYETPADREREEEAVRQFLVQHHDLEVEKLLDDARADYLVKRDGLAVGYLEVKTRTCWSNTYPTYHISRAKLYALAAMAQRDHLQAGLLVRWRDRLGFISVARFLDHATFTVGGRWDRNDRHDVEIMAEVPIDRFTFLDTGSKED